MTQERRTVGLIGENAASEFLENLGYCIVERNYRCSLGEIDIIARDGKYLVVVEVRTRTDTRFGGPEESITAKKAWRLKRLAEQYLRSVSPVEIFCRIDLVAVMIDRTSYEVKSLNHIRNILAG